MWSTEAREAVQNYSIYNMPKKADSAYMHTLHGLIHTLMRTDCSPVDAHLQTGSYKRS